MGRRPIPANEVQITASVGAGGGVKNVIPESGDEERHTGER